MADPVSEDQTASGVPAIQVRELLERIDAGPGRLLLLDVRSNDEFESWRFEARRPLETVHVPYLDFIDEPEESIAKVPRERELVVICARGNSSQMVAEMLKEAGIPSRNVQGGMAAYGDFLQTARVPVEAAFELWQINRRGRGCLSYVVVSDGEAIVVDPSRQVEWYEEFARRRNAKIVRVLDTHVHADHVSGGPALAERAGAPYFVAAGDGFELKQNVAPIDDGEEFTFGDGLRVRAIATPGHTPGSTCFLVGGKALLSGDTLFVSGVGRPDLGGHVEEWGAELFHTLHEKLSGLRNSTIVLPAHSSGPHEIDGDGVISANLGDLRRSSQELHLHAVSDFVDAMRAAIRTPPESYAHIIRTNLGAETPKAETIEEWEMGKNQCATGGAEAQQT